MNNLSHRERMASPQVHYAKNLFAPMEVFTSEEVVENNRFVKKSLRKTVDPRDNFKGVKVSDFYLQNVIAVGALDSLKGGMLSESSLDAADNLSAQLDKFDNALNNEGGKK